MLEIQLELHGNELKSLAVDSRFFTQKYLRDIFER